eukprot:SAG22_NODE_73_length_22318_cov_47.105315_21_plen_54_part_00
MRAALTNADTFGCTFPPAADPRAKAVILACVFLIDFIYFEEPANENGGGHHDD